MIPEEKIAVAIDTTDRDQVTKIFTSLQGHNVWMKIGMEAYYNFGTKIVLEAKNAGFRVFLDLKLHDIPWTVENSLKVLSKLPIDMINVHAAGGSVMMKKAADIIKSKGNSRPILLAVTQLTSLTQEEMNAEQRIPGDLLDSVINYAELAQKAGLDGVVCSPFEVKKIKSLCGHDFLCVTPGIRPLGIARNDQARAMTPMDALREGSDLLVIGRPITQEPSPKVALMNITKGSSHDD